MNSGNITLRSVITCPECGYSKEEVMPTDACTFFWHCSSCDSMLKPRDGDCCVYCSYGTVVCPPKQSDCSCSDPGSGTNNNRF